MFFILYYSMSSLNSMGSIYHVLDRLGSSHVCGRMVNSRKKVNTDSQVVMKKMNTLDCLLFEVGLVQLYIKPYFWKCLHTASFQKWTTAEGWC